MQTDIKLSTSRVYLLVPKTQSILPVCRHLEVSKVVLFSQIGSTETFDDSMTLADLHSRHSLALRMYPLNFQDHLESAHLRGHFLRRLLQSHLKSLREQ